MTRVGRPALSLLLVLIAFGPACDQTEEDTAPASLTGRWAGEVTFGDEAATLVLDLVQDQTAVAGTGLLIASAETVAFQVQGSYVAPSISMDLQFADRRPGDLNGLVSEDLQQMVVSLTGPSLSGTDVSLVRQ